MLQIAALSWGKLLPNAHSWTLETSPASSQSACTRKARTLGVGTESEAS